MWKSVQVLQTQIHLSVSESGMPAFLKTGEISIGIWRRFLFMKKGINKSILFYVVSVLFFIASAVDFMSGNDNSMSIVWLCLGSSFLCLGSTHKKKENNKTNTDDK